MESLTPVSPHISQSAKKRMFPGGSSSSRCKEVEVLGISPPANSSSVSKSSKQKEVVCHEIIDVDMEEDQDVVLLNTGEVDRGKGKEIISNFAADLSNLANDGSGSDVQMSDNNVDDLNSNLFYGEDEWIDTYYDDIVYDDYDTLQSHYDRMDIPPGVEMPFPWLPNCPQNNTEIPVTSVSNNTSAQPESHGATFYDDLGFSPPSVSKKSIRIRDATKSSSSKRITRSARQYMNEKLAAASLETGVGLRKYTPSSSKVHRSSDSSGGSLPQKIVKEPSESLTKNKRRFHPSHLYTNSHGQFSSWPIFSSTVHKPATLSSQTNSLGVATYTTVWHDLPMNAFEPGMGSFVPMGGSVIFPTEEVSNGNLSGASLARVEPKNLDEILQKFDLFKQFDTVEDYSDHLYSNQGSFSQQPPKNWAKRIQEEWKILENDLPGTIFVRVYESRMDLLRAVIVGAEGTPYHDGLFFFDIYFPATYPSEPPQVKYHSGGLRINPNLYNDGKVCLSLLNTWNGSHKERWLPGVSTILQVLVSIQGLILNAKPFFNEPGYADMAGSESGEKKSLEYNERTFIYSLQTMVYSMRRPPKYFEDFVAGHFCKRAHDILVSCKAYLDGAQVGCLVKGGVQDVDEGDKSCSQYFKTSLAESITPLVNTFSQVGAKDCEKFLPLAQKANGCATAVHR